MNKIEDNLWKCKWFIIYKRFGAFGIPFFCHKGHDLNKDTTDENDKELVQISRKCLLGHLKDLNDLLNKLKLTIKPGNYISTSNNDLNQEFILTDDDSQNNNNNNKKFDFNRSNLSAVEQSASSLNAKDIWLINRRDHIKKKLAYMQSLQMISAYMKIFYEKCNHQKILKFWPLLLI